MKSSHACFGRETTQKNLLRASCHVLRILPSKMRLAVFALSALAVVDAFSPSARAPPRTGSLSAVRRGRDGKTYIGEPEPMEEVVEIMRRVGGMIGRGATDVADGLFGKQPQPNGVPIPIEMPPDERDGAEPAEKDPFAFPPPSQPHGGDWGLDRF